MQNLEDVVPPTPVEIVEEQKTDKKKTKRTREQRDQHDGAEKKKKKTRSVTTQIGCTFIKFDHRFPKEFIQQTMVELKNDLKLEGLDLTMIELIEGERVSIKPTPEEIAKKRNEWTREYRNQPHIKEERKKKSNTEESKQKRAKYNSDPEVVQRKKLLNQRNRALKVEVKEKKPDLWDEVNQKSGINDPSYQGKKNWVPRKYWLKKQDEKKDEKKDETKDEKSAMEIESKKEETSMQVEQNSETSTSESTESN